jgi:hypothetical protein
MEKINEQDTLPRPRYAKPNQPSGDFASGERKLSVSKAVEEYISGEHTPPEKLVAAPPIPPMSKAEPATPAKPFVPTGDFAAGERTVPASTVVGDFASGEHDLPTSQAVGDFASGEHTVTASTAVGDFASGGHTPSPAPKQLVEVRITPPDSSAFDHKE